MSKRIGKNMKIAIGANKVLAIDTIGIPPVSMDQIEVTAMGDSWKSYMFGLKDGGELTFSGFWDPDDQTGQEALRLANLNATPMTNLFIFIDNTSYFVPCQTTGYFTPTNTSNMATQPSYLTITKYDVKSNIKGVAQVSFTAKLSGCMALV